MREIRAGFVFKGTSFHAWCTENQIDSHNARKAIIGKWSGPKAKKLVNKIKLAAGVNV
ncbi:hypothetical protein [Profundibacter sp.]